MYTYDLNVKYEYLITSMYSKAIEIDHNTIPLTI